MESVVAVESCATYHREGVQAAVRRCLDAVGGLESFVRPGGRVFCKVNLLVPATPEQVVTTHPEVVRAVIREVRRVGAIPLVGDNPALSKPTTVMRKAGLLAVLEEEKVELPDLSEVTELRNPAGRAFKSFQVSKCIADVDLLLNLPKLKTHALTYMTVALKNLFGLVPGSEKARWHFRAQAPEPFAMCICDLYGAVQHHFQGERRLLHLCDGIVAMEGDGPGPGGKPRPLEALLASTDGVALDRVACALAGLDPERLVVVREAAKRGMGESDLERIRWLGVPASHWAGVKLQPPPGSVLETELSARLMRNPWIKNRVLDRPLLDEAKCGGCQKCKEICPTDAIALEGQPGKPLFALAKCIRCYCCGEVCPEGAIHKSPAPLLGRLLGGRAY